MNMMISTKKKTLVTAISIALLTVSNIAAATLVVIDKPVNMPSPDMELIHDGKSAL
ncbi:hypothetical protein D3C76_920890 [compost metagenome]